jgi:hypothetical protein
MPNRRGLRLIGWAYGGVVAIVALIAFFVVTSNLDMSVEARTEPTVFSATKR